MQDEKIKMKTENKKLGGERKKIFGIVFIILIFGIFADGINFASAQAGETVGMSEPTVCCEKTKLGLFCQDVPEEECSTEAGIRSLPTSCESSSFCSLGFCFDSVEGTCLDNTPQKVCQENDGTWFSEKPAQCNLGCCILSDQAAFVTLTMCKRLSGFYGLETNYRSDITSEAACIATVGQEKKGACVYIKDFERTCKFTSRSECNSENIYGTSENVPAGASGGNDLGLTENQNSGNGSAPITGQAVGDLADGEVRFYEDKLCSAEELGTNCGITRQTMCAPGKEEVYFTDTCGNPANIYDAGKVSNKEYWANVKNKNEVCGSGSSNADSAGCGNCNYLLGSYCRASSSETARATYGNNICQSLNCVEENGKNRLHGESWCARGVGEEDSTVRKIDYAGAVGSKDYRLICINGKIRTEPCADFKQQECIENSLETPLGTFSEAACRPNRWQDCSAQKTRDECENSDKRDCNWLDGVEYVLLGSILNGTSLDSNSLAEAKKRVGEQGGVQNLPRGGCVPEIPPGLKFWSGDEAAGVCAQANAACPVTYEKKIGSDWKCTKNCDCLPGGPAEAKRVQLCMSIGDCGPKVNYVGSKGRGQSYKIFTQKRGENKD